MTCQFALMFFANQAAALAEMRRVLRPAAGWRSACSRGSTGIRSTWRSTGRSGRGSAPRGSARSSRSATRSALAAAIEAAGSAGRRRGGEQGRAVPGPGGFLAGEIEVDTASIPSMQSLGRGRRRELVAALRREMAGPLAAVTRDGAVVMPFHVLIATARRA